MANISNAFGKLTITTDTKETLYNFLLLHKEFEKDSYYYTEFDTDKNSENELKYLIENNTIEENNQVYYSTTFIALGRWSFESNVQWLMDTIKNDTTRQQPQNCVIKSNNMKSQLHFSLQTRNKVVTLLKQEQLLPHGTAKLLHMDMT